MSALCAPLDHRGRVVGDNYLVGDVLGVGGMGVVYAAVQRSLERTVALKMPRPDLVDDPTVRQRLRNEAIAGSRITHQNIVRVLDYGIDRDVPFVVMEHVAGPRLSQLLEAGPLPIPVALRIARQIVAGLEEAHAQGIVHADVKCDNVLVETLRDSTFAPRLIDFGIARFIDEPLPIGEPIITGTPEYLAPEVICGDAPGVAADIYAIGVMLYELVTGATPFAGGTSAEVMGRRLDEDAVPIAVRCPDQAIPPDFDALVMRALARDVDARFADACELGHALEELARTGSTSAGTSSNQPPNVFSTEATTATMTAGSLRPRIQLRQANRTGVGHRSPDEMVVACLEVVRSFVDDHRLGAAITEIEGCLVLLARWCPTAPRWRLQIMLAALYDGVGDRVRARASAFRARDNAACCGSATGCDRAEQLLRRLDRRRPRTFSRPW